MQKQAPETRQHDSLPSSLPETQYIDKLSLLSGKLLERADSLIYAIVGISFLLGGLVALGYGFWEFASQISDALYQTQHPNIVFSTHVTIATAVIQFVSDLLLVLIIMEVLGTITHYLRAHATSLRPFLFIGIISATRSILSIGARLSVAGGTIGDIEFRNAMIELGVSAAVVLALGITLKLLGRATDLDDQGD